MLRRTLLAAPAFAIKKKPGLRIAPFTADVTPPLGTPLCVGLVVPGTSVKDSLEARGVVLMPEDQQPIVLCAVDWLGIGNSSHDRWRAALAVAAGTVPARVAVQTVHQHDAPGDDASAEELLRMRDLPGVLQSESFAQAALRGVVAAVRAAKSYKVTEIGAGHAIVKDIASNRRILSPDGKFAFQRFTACKGSPYCDAPVGVIDPQLDSISFYNKEKRIVTLSYYATHPMSYYGKGEISADFVGMARRQQTESFAIHFTGAAGNIGAGKYNDGAIENRAKLAGRLGEAMAQARAAEKRFLVDTLRWKVVSSPLPLRPEFTEEKILADLENPKLIPRDRASAGRYLAWHRLVKTGRRIDISSLRMGPVNLIHMPGELFVEYQLAARGLRPSGETVAMAAYGDYGPMYIGTRKSYREGGYETGIVSRVAPQVEEVLLGAMREVLL
ncbi:MAG: hypothetical protein K2X03_25140 [Bryobacteraceae bacterium]|nr:hypothetical protein [Bryobacteraceae bacterium]